MTDLALRAAPQAYAADRRDGVAGQTLSVEPGAEAYTTITLGPGPLEAALQVRGLGAEWFTLSAQRLELASGQSASVELWVRPPTHTQLGMYRYEVEIRDLRSGQGSIVSGGVNVVGSRLLDYLPRIFRGPEHELLGRFLLIFQRLIEPIERTIDNRAYYFDPALTPAVCLPWLAGWLDLHDTDGMDEGRLRSLIARAVELYRWKGTRRGMRAELEVRTGARALVVEDFDGLRVGQDSALGINTQLGEPRDGCVVVSLIWPHFPDVEEQRIAEQLVSAIKPAHVGHIVRNLPPSISMEDR